MFCSFFISSTDGLGSARNKWINLAKAKDFMIVILPNKFNFCFDQFLQMDSILL